MPTDATKPILLLASLRSGSGNAATASRVAHELRTSGKFTVDCVPVDSPHTESDSFPDSIRRYAAVLALHVYRAGHLLTSIYKDNEEDLPPLILIFAGTELHSCEPKWASTMAYMIPRASGLVCFSQEWKRHVETTYGKSLPCRITVIPQSVRILPFIFEQLPLSFQFINGKKLVLWIGEIRSVKDPMFAVRFLSQLNNDDYHLVLIGHEHDQSLNDSIQSSSDHTNLTFLGGQSQNFVHTLMRLSFAYINTSIDEGMCLAMLEAMALGLPVLARRNTGNTSVIKNGKTGLMFDTPDEAARCLLELDTNPALRQALTRQAADHVRKYHDASRETKAYRNLLCDLIQ